MEKSTNYEMCKICGGVCCQENGCIYMPEDFRVVNFKSIRKEIDKGGISIAGQPFDGFGIKNSWSFLLYLRSQNDGADKLDLFSSGGPCALWSPIKGCTLSEEKRPALGLALKPTNIGGPCQKLYKSDALLHWMKYYEVLTGLIEYYTNEDAEIYIKKSLYLFLQMAKEKLEKGQMLTPMEEVTIGWYQDCIEDKKYLQVPLVRQRILNTFK